MGNPQTLVNITSRVYVSVTLIGILSAGTSWNKLTGSLQVFHIPSLFIFTLDITLKYISILGKVCADILTSVRLRSVGKNPQKAKAFSGIFLYSRQRSAARLSNRRCGSSFFRLKCAFFCAMLIPADRFGFCRPVFSHDKRKGGSVCEMNVAGGFTLSNPPNQLLEE